MTKSTARSKEHDWVKVHVCTGVSTNIVTAVEIHDRNASDTKLLPALVNATVKKFAPREISADKGYSSIDNHNLIEQHGATPFIAFKSIAKGTGSNSGRSRNHSVWEKMLHFLSFQKETFLAHNTSAATSNQRSA